MSAERAQPVPVFVIHLESDSGRSAFVGTINGFIDTQFYSARKFQGDDQTELYWYDTRDDCDGSVIRLVDQAVRERFTLRGEPSIVMVGPLTLRKMFPHVWAKLMFTRAFDKIEKSMKPNVSAP